MGRAATCGLGQQKKLYCSLFSSIVISFYWYDTVIQNFSWNPQFPTSSLPIQAYYRLAHIGQKHLNCHCCIVANVMDCS